MRIALFSGNYNYTLDGANKALNRLVAHLEEVEGAKVRVYSPTSPSPAFAPRGDLVSAPSVTIPTRPDYRFSLGLTPALKRDLDTFAPDLIHLSAPDLLGMGAQRHARKLGLPVVASVHTLFETYLGYYRLGWLQPQVEKSLAAFYRDCDYALTPTAAIADWLNAEGLAGRTRPWSRGVDRALFDPARRSGDWRRAQGFADSDAVVVFFGRLVLEKGLGVFVDTIDRLEAQGRRVSVLIVGEGPARPFLEARLPRAVFTGFLSGPELAQAVASGDILFNPSRTEAFCNVTLESMASGLAVIAADAPNHRVLLRHGRTGLLHPAEDVRACADAVGGLMDDAIVRARLGQAARVASADYSWPQILGGVADVYREAIAARTFSAAA